MIQQLFHCIINYINIQTFIQIHSKKFLPFNSDKQISLYPSITWQSFTEKQNPRLPPYRTFHRLIQYLGKIFLSYSHPLKRDVRVENTPEGVAATSITNESGTGWYTIAFHHDTVHTQEWRSYEPLGVDNSIRRRTMLRRRILCWVNVLARRPQRPSSNLHEWNCPWNLCSYWGMIVSLRQNSCSLKATLYNHPLPGWILTDWRFDISRDADGTFSFSREHGWKT